MEPPQSPITARLVWSSCTTVRSRTIPARLSSPRSLQTQPSRPVRFAICNSPSAATTCSIAPGLRQPALKLPVQPQSRTAEPSDSGSPTGGASKEMAEPVSEQTGTRMRARMAAFAVGYLLISLLSALSASAQQDVRAVRSAFVFNLTKYVVWPQSKRTLVIGLWETLVRVPSFLNPGW